MTRTLGTVLAIAALVASLAACGDQEAGGSATDCTEFSGTESTVGIRHDPGFELDGEVLQPEGGDASSTLGDLVLAGDGSDDAVLSVYESKASNDQVGLDAFAAVSRHVERTGSGPFNASVEPLPTTDVEIAGMPAHRATLSTTDEFVYTAWIIPGEQRSLDLVLAQTKASAAEEDLAEEVPGLVESGGCS